MENSILNGTKKTLGIDADYTAFDYDIIVFINMAFSTLNQLGIGPVEGFGIEDARATWDDLGLPLNQRNMVRTYIHLKTRMLFDPPTTSFHIEAMNNQIAEQEWRLNAFREALVPPVEIPKEEVEPV